MVYESASVWCCGLAAGAKTETMSGSVRNSMHFTGEWMCPLPLTRALRGPLVIQHRPSLGTSCIRQCQGPQCTPRELFLPPPSPDHPPHILGGRHTFVTTVTCVCRISSCQVSGSFPKGRSLLSWCVQLAVCSGLTWDRVHTGDSRSWAKVGTL